METLADDQAGFIVADVLRIGADGQHHLVGGACAACGLKMFPHAAVCPGCMEERVSIEEMPDEGVLYAFTTVHVARPPWNKPMVVGYVDLSNGVRVFAHLRGAPTIGGAVRLSTDSVGMSVAAEMLRNFVYAAEVAA